MAIICESEREVDRGSSKKPHHTSGGIVLVLLPFSSMLSISPYHQNKNKINNNNTKKQRVRLSSSPIHSPHFQAKQQKDTHIDVKEFVPARDLECMVQISPSRILSELRAKFGTVLRSHSGS